MQPDLIARIEAAQPSEARELFEEAWLAFHHDGYAPENAEDTCCLCIRFAALLDAEAYLDAAAMFVPEGWLVAHLSELGGAGGCCCALGNPGTGQDVTADAGERTMAFALLAAAMKARQTDERD